MKGNELEFTGLDFHHIVLKHNGNYVYHMVQYLMVRWLQWYMYYWYAQNYEVSVNDGPHIRRWSH